MTEDKEHTLRDNALKRWHFIKDTGSTISGSSPNINSDVPPVWFDKNKFLSAQKIARKYIGS